MSAEQVRQAALETMALADQSMRAVAPVGENHGYAYHDQASKLQFSAEQIPISLGNIADRIAKIKGNLASCQEFNAAAREALSGMPQSEVSSIYDKIDVVNDGIGTILEEGVYSAEEYLLPVGSSIDDLQQFATVVDQPPDINRPESSWSWLRFAFKSLKRLADSI